MSESTFRFKVTKNKSYWKSLWDSLTKNVFVHEIELVKENDKWVCYVDGIELASNV